MSGCQWLCLSTPPRRVFIDSRGGTAISDLKGLHAHARVRSYPGLIRPEVEVDLYRELSQATRIRAICGMRKVQVVSRWQVPGIRRVSGLESRVFVDSEGNSRGSNCSRSFYSLPPSHSCFFFSCHWQSQARSISHYGFLPLIPPQSQSDCICLPFTLPALIWCFSTLKMRCSFNSDKVTTAELQQWMRTAVLKVLPLSQHYQAGISTKSQPWRANEVGNVSPFFPDSHNHNLEFFR